MRILLLLLLLANVAFFAYRHLLSGQDEAAAQIAALQLSPEKIVTVSAGTAAPLAAVSAPPAVAAAACLEWSGLAGAELARADAALAALELPAAAMQRRVSDADGYWVHMPPLKTKAEVDRKVGELKALGVEDFYVVQDAGPWRNAVSLGLFKNEEAANAELERLRDRGVRTATVTRRERFLRLVAYFVREPDAATVARLTELQRGFPTTTLKAAACPQ